MKMDADEKELLGRAGRVEVRQGRQARADSLHALRQGYVPKRPAAEHPALEQGPGGDSEASARRGVAVSDIDREPAAQVCVRAAQRGLTVTPCSAHLPRCAKSKRVTGEAAPPSAR